MTYFLISLTVFTLSCWLSIQLVRYRFIAFSFIMIGMVSSVFLVYTMIIAFGELIT